MKPFSPEFVFEALRRYKIDIMRGRQEDAEEFLIIFLDLVDKELHSLAIAEEKSFSKITINNIPTENEIQEWTSVDRSKSKITTRTVKSQLNHNNY